MQWKTKENHRYANTDEKRIEKNICSFDFFMLFDNLFFTIVDEIHSRTLPNYIPALNLFAYRLIRSIRQNRHQSRCIIGTIFRFNSFFSLFILLQII